MAELRSFARDTAVEQIAAGRFVGSIDGGWAIGGKASGGKANGGYMLALAARAMAAECGRADPVTITAHYLNPGLTGPVRVDVCIVESGKRLAVVTATLAADDKPILQVLGSFSDLSLVEPGFERIDAEPPVLPAPELCIRHGVERGAPPLFGNLDLRLHPDDAGFTSGNPSGAARVRGWFRFANHETIDTHGLLLAVDAFPPTAFNARLPVSWTPTVELTTHVRARPAPGWLRATFSTRFVSGGLLEEDGEIWDSTDRLVAQSRQLAMMPRERGRIS